MNIEKEIMLEEQINELIDSHANLIMSKEVRRNYIKSVKEFAKSVSPVCVPCPIEHGAICLDFESCKQNADNNCENCKSSQDCEVHIHAFLSRLCTIALNYYKSCK